LPVEIWRRLWLEVRMRQERTTNNQQHLISNSIQRSAVAFSTRLLFTPLLSSHNSV
jgi:hypothetical protein